MTIDDPAVSVVFALATMSMAPLLSARALAQQYPQRPIRVVVPTRRGASRYHRTTGRGRYGDGDRPVAYVDNRGGGAA